MAMEQYSRPSPLPRPVPGVHVSHHTPAACGLFAIAWADFEPLPDTAERDIEFVVAELALDREPDRPVPPELAAAFGAGAGDLLLDRGGGRAVFRTRVVLRDAIWHVTDSSEHTFHVAGRLAAQEALDCLAEDRVPRPVGRAVARARFGTRPFREPPMRQTRVPDAPADDRSVSTWDGR